MNRLQYIVSEIDLKLKQHAFPIGFTGLCEQELKDEKTVPTFYQGYGDSDFAGFDDTNGLNVYHRLISYEQVEDPEKGFGTKPFVDENYSMIMVAYGNQREVDDAVNNINYNVADDLRTLFLKKLTKVQLANLTSVSGIVTITGTEHDRQAVFSQELPDNEMKVSPETLLFAIQYNINLQYIGDCKDLSCELKDVLIDLSSLSCANINDDTFGLTDQQIIDCGLDPASIYNVSNSDDTFSVNIQADLELADINHIDGDGSSNPTAAQTVFVATPDARTLKVQFPVGVADDFEFEIEVDQAATFDLAGSLALSTNVATLVFELNTVVVTGNTAYVNTDDMNVIITRTNGALDSEVVVKSVSVP